MNAARRKLRYLAACEELGESFFDAVGADIVCYSSDYCHFDCAFPHSVNILEKRSDLSEPAKQRLFSQNAAALYKLEVPS